MFKFSKRSDQKSNAWLQVDDAPPCLIEGQCSIGRAKTNTARLTSQKASRIHALIHVQEQGEYWLVDQGSSNGTYLNGRRVVQPCHLKEGDLVQIGEHRILFHLRLPDEKERQALLDENQMTVREMEQTPCWFLVADIENFVALGTTMDADSLARATGEWFAACNSIIQSHRGSISQYLGAGFLAYWDGRKIPARQISDCIRGLKETMAVSPLKFRLAAHFGKASSGVAIVAGNGGLFGQDVNMAFRMEKLAKSLSVQCIISQSAWEALSRPAEARDLGRHAVRGFEGQHLFFAL